MTARSPSALMLSALFHGGIIAVIFLLAYVANDSSRQTPKILELVAGPGDNYAATVAPALGVADGIKLSVPNPPKPAPRVEPEPVAPAPETEASPVTAAPIEKPKPAPPAPVKPAASANPNFKQMIRNKIVRADSQAKRELKKEREAAAKITKEQFDRANKAKAVATAAAKNTPPKLAKIDAEGIKKGVVGGSTENKTEGAGGRALTREEGTLIEAYFARLKTKLKENHEKPPGLSDTVSARVEFFVAADGTVSRVRIIRSSRNAEFDRSVLEAFARTTSVGSRPDGKGDLKELEFKMRDEEAD